MSDISKINVDGVDYDVKDTIARTEVTKLNGLSIHNFTLDDLATVKIKFYNLASALILITGTTGLGYGALTYNGYGIGGTTRVHLGEIIRGSNITYEILSEDSVNNTNGISITNTNNSGNSANISVLVLYGTAPTFELVQ